MGIIGTVMGLVHVLENLSAPSTLGPAISGAFIATLMGVGAANVVFLPVAGRLKGLSHAEMHERNLVLEGILSIQAGDNPRVVAEKLMSLVPPAERVSKDEAKPNLRVADEPAEAGRGGLGPWLHRGVGVVDTPRRSTRTTSAGCSPTRT
jgi:chemotaxis protein MotA